MAPRHKGMWASLPPFAKVVIAASVPWAIAGALWMTRVEPRLVALENAIDKAATKDDLKPLTSNQNLILQYILGTRAGPTPSTYTAVERP